ncbi:protein of unknown function [Tenacibaculum insulae]
MWFFQGFFLFDDKKVLQNAQEGKTKAMRQWRFYNLKDIDVNLVRHIKNSEEGKELKTKKKYQVNRNS